MGMGIEDFVGLTLSTIGGGGLEEIFQVELGRALRNIDDPNTADGKREIIIKIALIPNGKRSAADMLLSGASKLQPDLPIDSMVYLGKQGAKLKAWEHNPEQMRLPIGESDIQGVEMPTKTIGGIRN